jgi:oligosaccharyl transferase (archaeosortase A-associated)
MNRISLNAVIGLLITSFFSLSLLIRTVLPFDRIFSGDWIRFSSIDAYYHMYLVDNMVHNFPNITGFNPYFIFPDGASVAGAHFFNWLLGFITWVVGLGSPTQHTIDIVGVYFPAFLAALTVIPVYFIGKTLFNKWAGVIGAALIAILPGEFLGRSILGFTDQHIAETFFTTIAALFLILAIKHAGTNQITLRSILQRDWQVIRKPLLYGLLAGFFLGIYLITWLGGLLFVFIIGLYFVLQFIIDHLKGRSTEYLGITGFVVFLMAMIIFLPFSPPRDVGLAVVAAVIIPPVLAGISRLVSSRGLKPYYYPVGLMVIGVLFLVIFALAAPDLYDTVTGRFAIFNPGGASAETTIEMQSFLFPDGEFTSALAWGNFTTGFFMFSGVAIPGFGLIALIVMIWLYVKRRGEENHWLFFIIWTIVMIIATVGQRRFAYYLAVNIALLTAYISYQIIWLGGLRNLVNKSEKGDVSPERRSGKSKPAKSKKTGQAAVNYHLNIIGVAVLSIIVLFTVFFWNIQKAVDVAKAAYYVPADAWQESLLWVKDNTPEPFGDPEGYYAIYDRPPAGEKYDYPDTAYGVTSWWDYGYWITRTAQRIPSANPSQAPAPIKQVAELLLSQEWPPTPETLEILDHLKTRYFMIDFAMTLSKFHAVANWAGTSIDEYLGLYVIPTDDGYVPKYFYYPEYYRTLVVRLFQFEGEAVDEVKPTVIEWDLLTGDDGGVYRVINKINSFDSYQDALDYLQTEAGENSRIVGLYPFVSPVVLEEMDGIRAAYTSEGMTYHSDLQPPDWESIRIVLPEVKVFEYTGD